MSIRFNWQNHDELRCSLEPMRLLALSLFERSVIPEIRIAYFKDPNFNLGGRGKSREEIFESNGTSGDEILSHPHFLKYLEYFLCGPNLPSLAIDTFKREALCSGYLTGGASMI